MPNAQAPCARRNNQMRRGPPCPAAWLPVGRVFMPDANNEAATRTRTSKPAPPVGCCRRGIHARCQQRSSIANPDIKARATSRLLQERHSCPTPTTKRQREPLHQSPRPVTGCCGRGIHARCCFPVSPKSHNTLLSESQRHQGYEYKRTMSTAKGGIPPNDPHSNEITPLTRGWRNQLR